MHRPRWIVFLVAVIPGVAILLAYFLAALFPHEIKE